MLCAAPVHENTGFCGQTVSKSTSVHEKVAFGGWKCKTTGILGSTEKAGWSTVIDMNVGTQIHTRANDLDKKSAVPLLA